MMARKVFFLSLILLWSMIGACSPEEGDGQPATPVEIQTQSSAPGAVPAAENMEPTTYYVRPDGGSSEQCSGLADAPYPGSGSGQPCAWDHPFRALPPGGPARLAGGDSLVIGSGSYMMGYGAPGAEACESDSPWECYLASVPSGRPGVPTRILGAGWDGGCSNPPELWGTERADFVLNLAGSNDVEVACLAISDHAGCVEFHSGSLACQRENYPFGPWAATGLYAADSARVSLRDLDIHGLAHGGVLAGRLADWTAENVRIAANGWVGWDGDIDGDDANSGALTFRRLTVEWNGCAESYPGGQPEGCWAQSAGGYGDGLGTGETGGIWTFEDSAFLHNTSDGLDLLYTRIPGSQVIIRRTLSAGNAGDQIKTSGPTLIENVVANSQCGFFAGQPFTFDVDNCRAGGSAIALSPRPGDQITVVNSTITGQGDCLVIAECVEGGGCNGSETVLLRNNIFLGNPQFDGDGDTTCLAWTGLDHDPFSYETSIMTGLKGAPEPCPAGSLCGVDPGLFDGTLEGFDAHLLAGSPAIDAGTAAGAPADDFSGTLRDSRPDIGAYEWREIHAWVFLPFTIKLGPWRMVSVKDKEWLTFERY